MLDGFWGQLKSGTDIRGVALEGVDNEPVTLTNEVVQSLIGAFSFWLSEKLDKPAKDMTVAVGHDSRLSAERIKVNALAAFSEAGFQVLDCGLSSTPAMFMTTVDNACDGAIQITASHHPYHRNGLKFFTRAGGLESEDITTLLHYAQEGTHLTNPGGNVQTIRFMLDYARMLRTMIQQEVNAPDYSFPLKGFKIVVDAGNGAGGFYARDVLEPLGADVSASQFLEPDGRFPNHIPNPEDPAAMQSVCDAVIRAGADLGVIFDTDVDRAGCVDSQGQELGRNRLIALASVIALENNPGGTIVTDSVTSSGLKPFIESTLGGKHHRFMRGYKNVINESIRLNQEGVVSPLAIETSGHAAFRENYFLDDGAYLSTKIIIKMAQMSARGKKLESLINTLEEPAEAAEYRFKIKAENFKDYGNAVIDKFFRYAAEQPEFSVAPDNYEGLRVSFDESHGDGWFLLRLSVHDPIMPLNIESNRSGGIEIIKNQILEFLQQFEELDVTSISD